MDGFEKHIKGVLENYEAPYSDEVWLNIEKKLTVKSRVKYLVASFASLILIIGSILYFNYPEKQEILKTQPQISELIMEETPVDVIITPEIKPIIIKKVVENIEIIPEEEIIEDVIIEEEISKIEEIQFEELIIEIPKKDTIQDTPIVIPPVIVPVKEKIKYFIPNTFTPNGDGLNDEFSIIGEDLYDLRFELLVYDMWGNLVFETINPDYKWNGENCEQGVYAWLLRVQDNEGEIFIDKGTITIIR